VKKAKPAQSDCQFTKNRTVRSGYGINRAENQTRFKTSLQKPMLQQPNSHAICSIGLRLSPHDLTTRGDVRRAKDRLLQRGKGKNDEKTLVGFDLLLKAKVQSSCAQVGDFSPCFKWFVPRSVAMHKRRAVTFNSRFGSTLDHDPFIPM
jgi:hypothetical protein